MGNAEIAGNIKAATAALHRQLEDAAVSRRLMSPAVNDSIYIIYLQAAYQLHSPVEDAVFPVLAPLIPAIETRCKAALVKEDLQQLGVMPIALPLLQHEGLNSIFFALGMMYVTEGATLGGLYILKNLREFLGKERPYTFLSAYGNRGGQQWKQFLYVLEQHAATASEKEKQEIINGALFAFKRALHIFNPTHVADAV